MAGIVAPLPFDAPLAAYEQQATQLIAAFRAGVDDAVEFVWGGHPRFLDPDVPWKPRDMPEADVRSAPFDLDDARLVVARGYNFADWSRLAEYVAQVGNPASDIAQFEAAVEAVIAGDEPALARLLAKAPALAKARSTRVTCFAPPVHAATLLHYVAANGVENYRQRTPPNAVSIARMLLDAGADPDALAYLYGGECTVMSMLVSSAHPAAAGVQIALVDLLVDGGASVEPRGAGSWTSPLATAIVFGYVDTARALVRRGARVSSLSIAAGIGNEGEFHRLLADAAPEERHLALAFAAQNGHAEIVRAMLDAGEDPNRFNPPGGHSHSTPLHQAALAGHEAVVRLLVERGARLDIKDTLWHATPLGWAEHGGQDAVARYLRHAADPVL